VRLIAEDEAGSLGGVMADALSLRALGPDGQGEGLLKHPRGLAMGPDGSLYIAADARVWKRSPDGALTPFAGTGESGYGGDGGPATSAKLRKPMGVALGADGSLYIADVADNRVRRVAPNENVSTTLGDGSTADATEGEIARGQPVNKPTGVAVDPQGAIYVSGHDRIVRIGPDGILTIYAGGADAMTPPVDSAPLAILTAVTYPTGLAFAPDGTLYAADRNRIFKVDTEGRFIHLAWDTFGELGDGVAASRAAIAPESLALLPTGDLLFADREMNRVRVISQALPGVGASDMLIASQDGKEAYVFDRTGLHLRTVDAMTGVTTLQFGYDSQGRVATLTDRDGNQTRVERDASGAPTAIVAPFGQRTALSLGSDGMLKSIADPMGGQVSMTYSKGLMATYTDARGGVHRFSFDDAGLLIKDEDPAGGSKTLTRTMTGTGFNVDVTTAMGRKTSHRVDFSYPGGTTWRNTAPDGTSAVSSYKLGNWEASYPDGSNWTAAEQPDPRFGLQAPALEHSTYTTAGGLTVDAKIERTVVLSDAANPFAVKQMTEKSTVNDKVTTSTYDAVARTLTLVSPMGRQVVQTLDAKGRVVRRAVAGFAPVSIAYDDHGRPTSVQQGARQVSLGYDANGFLSSITDPLLRVIGFQNDLMGRVTRQTAPDGTQTLFGYDRASNITSVTPPGREPYAYGYTPVDLEASFAPPAVESWNPATSYSYDVDQALTNVSRPDATNIAVAYDTAGRPVEIDHPTGPIALGYDSSGRLASAATPEESLEWSYDGRLMTQAKWSGAVSGSVEYSYDNDFRLTGTTVNGKFEALRTYDDDGMLVQAGELVINRDPKNGLVVSTDAGVVHEAYAYNEFGEVMSFTVTNQATGDVFLEIRYMRDALGRITKKVETTDGATKTFEYSYDQANRLAEVKTNGVVTASWTYDANGNRTSETKGGSTVTASYDGQDRLVRYGAANYQYGNAGELRSRTEAEKTTSYAYDALGNLTSVQLSDGTRISYVVDAQGRRVGRARNGELEQGFLWESQLRIAAELDGTGKLVRRWPGKRKATPSSEVTVVVFPKSRSTRGMIVLRAAGRGYRIGPSFSGFEQLLRLCNHAKGKTLK
jgi:YD repeat-containing protein